jgi:UDP-3-O-[3-hydroxymyristoyl] N-acetylglucosamine deacetylase
LEGVGIHSGAACAVTVSPADADTGRVFCVGSVEIPARADFVVDTARCTTLGKDEARVRTVEHLLSALYGLGIDNARMTVDGPEIPILDGSALPFVAAIQAVGIRAQGSLARTITPSEPIEVRDGVSLIRITPANALTIEVETEFADWPEGFASICYPVSAHAAEDYAKFVAPARTFAMRREVEMLLAAGLAQGGSLENALIITPPDTFSTPLRLPNEWCAHKLLDLLGDLALADARLNIDVFATRPGHRINTLAARRLLTSA